MEGVQQYPIVFLYMSRTFQLQLRNGISVAAVDFSIDVRGDVKDNRIVGRVGVMTMFEPVGRGGVYFDVSCP